MEVKLHSQPNRNEWTELLNTGSGTFFHTFEWNSLVESHFGIKCRYAVARDKDRAVGGLPYYIIKKGFLKAVVSPLIKTESMYGGPMALPKHSEAISAFVKSLNSVKPNGIYFKMKSEPAAIRSLGFGVEANKNYFLSLSKDVEVIWKKLGKKTRNQTRKAQKSQIKVEAGNRSELLNTYHSILSQNFERLGLKPLSLTFYAAALRKLPENFRVYVAYLGKTAVAGAVFIVYNKDMIYWSGSSLKEYSNLNPNNLIQWNSITWAAQKGVKEYDLGGAGIPSIAHFKEGWADRMRPYYRVYKSSLPTRLMIGAYKLMRSVPW